MKLLGSAEKDVDKDKDGEDAPKLEFWIFLKLL